MSYKINKFDAKDSNLYKIIRIMYKSSKYDKDTLETVIRAYCEVNGYNERKSFHLISRAINKSVNHDINKIIKWQN